MADTDMKTISELDARLAPMGNNTLFPIVIDEDNTKTTKRVAFGALRNQVRGIDFTGTLSAGNTSLTINTNATTAYSTSTAYSVGDRCTNSGNNYICVIASTAGSWDDRKTNFMQYSPATSSSTLDIYTNVFGVNPTNVSVSSGSITLTFPSQSSNVNVKVRVS